MARRRSIIISDGGVETEYASCAAAGKDKGVHESTIQRLVKNPGAATKTGMTGRYADEAPAKAPKPRKAPAKSKSKAAPPDVTVGDLLAKADEKRAEAEAAWREAERLRAHSLAMEHERNQCLEEAEALEQAAEKLRAATEEVAALLKGSTGMKPAVAKAATRSRAKAPRNAAGPVVATPAAIAESAARAAKAVAPSVLTDGAFAKSLAESEGAVARRKSAPPATAALERAKPLTTTTALKTDDWKGESGISAVRKDDPPPARLRPADLAQCGILVDDDVYEDATQAADAMDWDPMELTNALLAGDSQFEGRSISLDHDGLEEIRAVA